MAATRPDPCSCANLDSVTVRAAHLEWTVDFDAKCIQMLDSKDLSIKRVHAGGAELSHTLTASAHSAYGSELCVTLPTKLKTGEKFSLEIAYNTGPKPTALQFLRPEQTADKTQPFVFSQCQAIHARSMMPCMDSPAVKFTYTANVRAPKDIVMLMSAVRGAQLADSADSNMMITSFEQKIPVPAYLVAIAGGALECRSLGARTAVWSEPSLADKSAAEFAPTEKMLETAESLMGPYVWGRYDLLVLPPSFPYGGMENPCMTFVTPTLLGSDGARCQSQTL